MTEWWQTLPQGFDPIAFSSGFFSVSWYALFYLGGMLLVSFLLFRSPMRKKLLPAQEDFFTLLTFLLWGILLGARLGFVMFYGGSTYWEHPVRIFSPYDFETGIWTGIRGLSFFGGFLGGTIGLFLFAQSRRLSFWNLADSIIPFVPVGLFLGRLGNFWNGELIGRPTRMPWGIESTFEAGVLRHPSQFYEALGEGLLLFMLIQLALRRERFPGFLTVVFLVGYGCIRFFLEFFREPDLGANLILFSITLNQALSLAIVGLGLWLAFLLRRAWYNVSNNGKRL